MTLNLILASISAGEVPVEGLISDLAFILILGAVVTVLFKWLKQPVVLGYIVAGFLASPNFEYLPSVTTAANIDFWAQLGIIVLLFSLGLEFSFKKLLNAGVGSGHRHDNRDRNDVCRFWYRPFSWLYQHKQPLPRRHVVHVFDDNHHKGIH